MALIRMRVQKTFPLIEHQLFQDGFVLGVQELIEIFDEELLCVLQTFPGLGRFDDEGAVRSHGCISLVGVVFH
jgi:hypothetical protein